MLYIKFPISNFKSSIPEKGVSIFFSVIILAILLSIALGLSTILVGQVRMLKGMEDSVTAFYAAETGMERILYEDKMCYLSGCDSLGWSCVDIVNCDDGRAAGNVSGSIGKASYQANVDDGATVISSQGIYGGTRRAIGVER